MYDMHLINSYTIESVKETEIARLDPMTNVLQPTKIFLKVEPIIFLIIGNFGRKLIFYLKLRSE